MTDIISASPGEHAAAYSFPIDPSLLAAFLTVADAGRILAASRALHLSQPAVTARIRRLESQVGAALFLRSSRGVALTAAGRRFYDSSRRVVDLVERSVAELAPAAEETGPLRIAASTTLADHVLPPLLAAFAKARPTARITLSVGNTEEVLGWVGRGDAPLGLVEGHGRRASVRLERFVDDEIVPCRGTGLRGEFRRAADLSRHPVLWREQGSGTRAVVERALQASGLGRKAVPAAIELGSTESIKNAVIAGLGIGFLSRWSIRNELALGRLAVIPVRALFVRRTFRWALPSGSLRGTAASFHRFCRLDPAALPFLQA